MAIKIPVCAATVQARTRISTLGAVSKARYCNNSVDQPSMPKSGTKSKGSERLGDDDSGRGRKADNKGEGAPSRGRAPEWLCGDKF